MSGSSASICKYVGSAIGEAECDAIEDAISSLTPSTAWQYVIANYGVDSPAAEEILNMQKKITLNISYYYLN